MSYSGDGDRVTIEMSLDDWEHMLVAFGIAAASLRSMKPHFGHREFWRFMALLNRLNEGNEAFTPYEIPEEFRA